MIDPNEIKRYTVSDCGISGVIQSEEDLDGYWCKWEDVEKLQKENQELKDKLNKAAKILIDASDTMLNDNDCGDYDAECIFGMQELFDREELAFIKGLKEKGE